jgi:hypothetical protein
MLRKLFFLMPLAVLVSACGGGSSGGGLTASPVSVSVAGLEVGESLDVSMETGNTVNTLTFSGTNTNPRNFPTRVLPGVSYRLSILNPPAGAGCVFVASQRTRFDGSDVLNDDTRVSCRGAIADGGGDGLPQDVLSFLSAEPAILGLKGSSAGGAPELSILEFQVFDNEGRVVEDELVLFESVTSLGGFQLNIQPASSRSDEDGIARVTVRSGSVPGTYGVTASLARDPAVKVQGNVTVTAGLPVQNRFSLAVTPFNVRGWNLVGATADITVAAGDRLGNAVPDGIAINFASELGFIVGSCVTQGGTCSVQYRSLGSNQTHNYDALRSTRTCPGGVPCNHDRYGRTTITAWALGEESFPDRDGTNRISLAQANSGDFSPLPEVFFDYNETRTYEGPVGYAEDFIDANVNGVYDPVPANPKFKGVSCDDAAKAAGHCAELAMVRDSLVVVNSTDAVQAFVFDPADDPTNGAFRFSWQAPGGGPPQPNNAVPVSPPPALFQLSAATGGFIRVVVADLNGNAPIAGSEVSIDSGDLDTIGADSCEVLPVETEPHVCQFFVLGDPTAAPPFAPILITVTSAGIESVVAVIPLVP